MLVIMRPVIIGLEEGLLVFVNFCVKFVEKLFLDVNTKLTPCGSTDLSSKLKNKR